MQSWINKKHMNYSNKLVFLLQIVIFFSKIIMARDQINMLNNITHYVIFFCLYLLVIIPYLFINTCNSQLVLLITMSKL